MNAALKLKANSSERVSWEIKNKRRHSKNIFLLGRQNALYFITPK